MAFISLLFVFFVFAMALMISAIVVGRQMFITGIQSEKISRWQGRKCSYTSLVFGCILMGIPVLCVNGCAALVGYTIVDIQIGRLSYECVADAWRNEHISDERAMEDAIEELLKAADSEDRETIKRMFAKNIDEEVLDARIDEFLKVYPNGLSEVQDIKIIPSGSWGGGEEGFNFACRYEALMNGEHYYMSIEACYANNVSKDRIGVTLFTVQSEKSYVLDYDFSDSRYLFAQLEVEHKYDTRRVDGKPYIFKSIDRELAQKEVLKVIRNDSSFIAFRYKYGMPNIIKDDSYSNDRIYIYELKSDDGTPLYLHIETKGTTISLKNSKICNDETTIAYLQEAI